MLNIYPGDKILQFEFWFSILIMISSHISRPCSRLALKSLKLSNLSKLSKPLKFQLAQGSCRSYLVLAIESSCDDSTVCLIDKPEGNQPPTLIDHIKESLDNSKAGGIVPLDARNHHQKHMAPLVQLILDKNKVGIKHNKIPELVCATRGPGMLGSLASGYNVAKGLAAAWDVPLVGVHHMLGHLLTPRFFQDSSDTSNIPQYPFVSLLVSGGHTMLVLSESVTKHRILANTMDIAIGDMLDKCARELGMHGSMLAKELEDFIMSTPPNELESDKASVDSSFQFPNPLSNKYGQSTLCAYSFAGFLTHLRISFEKYYPNVENPAVDLSIPVRRELARRLQKAMFNHVVTKSAKALQDAIDKGVLKAPTVENPLDFVCSGGVGSNMTLRSMLNDLLCKKLQDNQRKKLKKLEKQGRLAEKEDAKGEMENTETKPDTHSPGPSKSSVLKFHFPPPKWCTDNALMIGWAGIELYESCGMYTDLGALPTAKWPIEKVTEFDGWLYRDGFQKE